MKKMTKYINTMRDLEIATYGGNSNGNLLKAAGIVGSLGSGFTGSSDAALNLNGTAATGLTAPESLGYDEPRN